MKKQPPNNPGEPIVPQGRKRLDKSAQVDEQLFQEGLSVALDNEKRRPKSKSKKSAAPPPMDSRTAQAAGTIEPEFQSMIDALLPSAKKEQVACLHGVGKPAKSGGKERKKSPPPKKSGKRRGKPSPRSKKARK
ncbi:MAG: hypothetical protein HQL88_08470 [Magnetococcales bacterium]|nr:hypothetical protein [Magnetococcales bacterium]